VTLVIIVVLAAVVAGNLLTIAFLRGSTLRSTECPFCLGHDTFVSETGAICRDCNRSFSPEVSPGSVSKAA
jgi:hypothetical protein